MSKQLGELGCLNDIPLHIAKNVITECLHDLVDVEEHDIYRVAFKCSHGILNDERVVTVGRHEQCHRCYRIQRSPVQQVLQLERYVARQLVAQH